MDAANDDRNAVIEKIINMPAEQVSKVLIFMAGMEAGEGIKDTGRPAEDAGRLISCID